MKTLILIACLTVCGSSVVQSKSARNVSLLKHPARWIRACLFSIRFSQRKKTMRLFATVVFVLAFLPPLRAAEPQIGDDVKIVTDVRYLKNFPIDLNPVHRWFKSGREGVRPLSAWKRFDLIQINQDYVGKKVCMVKNEAGEFEEICINNFPVEMKTYMDKINSLKADVASMKAEIIRLEPIIRAESVVTPTAAGGTLDYVEERMDRRAAVNLAAANLVTKKENLARAQAALDSYIAAAPTAGELFLVKYGGTWSKYTVWEHGQRPR